MQRTDKLLALALNAFLLVGMGNAVAVPCHLAWEPADGSYDFPDKAGKDYRISGDAVIYDIQFTRLEVFDESNPDENNALYRFLNRTHIKTREVQIRKLLLVKEGEPYDARLVEESARLLRSQRYLYDADIRAVSHCGGYVELEVITRDSWTLAVDASFDRSGGDNNSGFGVRDSNFLGTGIELSVKAKEETERDTLEFLFKDDNLFGSRLKSRLSYSHNDDGKEYYGLIELPFYSLDSRRAWKVSAGQTERIDEQFFRGDEITEVQHDIEDYRVAYGFSSGLKNGVTQRWYAGWSYEDHEFSPGDELPPPSVFPTDRTLSYPYLEFSSVEDQFVERVNFNQFERTEDVFVGHSFMARLGYSSDSWGGDQNRIVLQGYWRNTLAYTQQHYLHHQFEFEGLRNLDSDESEDLVLDYNLNYIYTVDDSLSYRVDLRAMYSKNLNTNRQIYLGGETGLRAFENRFQTGDRLWSLNIERRRFTDIHLFSLIRVGWAYFLDVGRAWDPEVDEGFEDDYLVNVGFGLRLASSKSDAGRFLHIDFSVPLTNRDEPDVDSSQVTVRLVDEF